MNIESINDEAIDDESTTLSLLEDALSLLSAGPDRWCVGKYARDSAGGVTNPLGGDVCSTCLEGALWRASGVSNPWSDESFLNAHQILTGLIHKRLGHADPYSSRQYTNPLLDSELTHFNDSSSYEDVMSLLKEAISNLESVGMDTSTSA